MATQLRVLGILFAVLSLVSCATVAPKPPDGRLAAGVWREDWNPNKETDVTYHDEYRVRFDKNGRPDVRVLKRDQQIENEAYNAGVLSFVHITSFRVSYVLRLSQDGRTFRGTARTPDKTVEIRWKKIQ